MSQVVVLDACVLYPAPLRDLLMWSATQRLISIRWSREIMNEWLENLLIKRPDLMRERLERTCDEMNRAMPDALVEGYEEWIPGITLRDPNDRHVVAVAIKSEAEVIITSNLKDFPKTQLPDGIEAVAPDEYLCRLFDHNPLSFLATLSSHRASLSRPQKSAIDYLETLRNCGLTQLVTRASVYLVQI